MSYVCPICLIDPLSHSLIKVKEIDDILIFYSCPSQAKLYFDVEGIMNHYNGVLSEIKQNQKWIWIFDSYEFNLNHLIEINVGIQLAKLISSKFSHNLLNIIIINPNIYTSLTHNLLKPFLSEKINEIINFDNYYKNINDILINFNKKNIKKNI
jgi:hypothetical protein